MTAIGSPQRQDGRMTATELRRQQEQAFRRSTAMPTIDYSNLSPRQQAELRKAAEEFARRRSFTQTMRTTTNTVEPSKVIDLVEIDGVFVPKEKK